MTLQAFKEKSKKIPDAPGVYFFLGPRREVLYIGKATSLRDRLRSYFAPDLPETRGPLITAMVAKARSIDWRATDSVLEALILEANLIQSHKPPHNTDLKDDKSFNYVVITKEAFPRVRVVRGRELEGHMKKEPSLRVFGPFPHGLQLKEALRIIRKIFPYRDDRCVPCGEKKNPSCRACFNRSLGLCPGVCTGDIDKTQYRRIVRRITLLFEGKKTQLLQSLERDMKAAAREEEFEEAQRLRGQLFALRHIQDVSLIKEEYRPGPSSSARIEAYDVAHMGGKSMVGVMTVVEEGAAARNHYRKFRIHGVKGGDDPGALREVLSRRLGHDEWPLPRLIVVDGAAAQINAAEAVLASYGLRIPVVGVVKDEKHRPRELRGDRAVVEGRERDVLLANAEAHRFAIGYHRRRNRGALY